LSGNLLCESFEAAGQFGFIEFLIAVSVKLLQHLL
jgi:hypothetical protein